MRSFTSLRMMRFISLVLFPLIGFCVFPAWICTLLGRDLNKSTPETLMEMVKGMDRWTDGTLSLEDLSTGNPLYDGEWYFGTFQMAALGYGQACLLGVLEPDEALERMERCFTYLRSDPVRAFDTQAWGSDPIKDLAQDEDHHVSYLGYYNLAMSLGREIMRRHPEAKGLSEETLDLNNAVTHALARRFRNEHSLLLDSYPREIYPVDNAAAIASLGLYSRARDTDEFSDLLEKWEENCRAKWRDPDSGLLYQSVSSGGVPLDLGRASGTALAAYFLAYSHPELAAELSTACFSLGDTRFGFGMVREYAHNINGQGDIDSGPVLFGYGATATGVSIANTRIHGNTLFYRDLLRTAVLTGAPAKNRNELHWISGGSIGDAILFAMFTAPELDLIYPEGRP